VFHLSATAHADPNELARTAAIDFARRFVQCWQEALGTELLGAYLIGSLAHAGFNRRYSDIDLAIITAAGLSQDALDGLKGNAVALSTDWGPKVSVFWADRHFAIGRFPPLDRIDYLDRAVALMEREHLTPPRPTLDEIRQYLRGATFATWVERAQSFAGTEALKPKDHKMYLRTILYPGRFYYSWMTGRIGSNEDAVAFLNERPLAGLDVGLIVRALRCRQAAADPDGLFPARTTLPSQFDACAKLIADGSGPAS
jgi:predicted nucleotidyltransferase